MKWLNVFSFCRVGTSSAVSFLFEHSGDRVHESAFRYYSVPTYFLQAVLSIFSSTCIIFINNLFLCWLYWKIWTLIFVFAYFVRALLKNQFSSLLARHLRPPVSTPGNCWIGNTLLTVQCRITSLVRVR